MLQAEGKGKEEGGEKEEEGREGGWEVQEWGGGPTAGFTCTG